MLRLNLPTTIALAIVTCVRICAQDTGDGTVRDPKMKDRPLALMTALKIEPGSTDKIDRKQDSFLKNTTRLEKYLYKETDLTQIDNYMHTKYVLTSENGTNKIYGKTIEADTPQSARLALFQYLTTNTMPFDMLIEKYVVRDSVFGDLCIGERRFDTNVKTLVIDKSRLYFVRGNTVVILRSDAENINIESVAQAVDDLCKSNQIERKTANINGVKKGSLLEEIVESKSIAFETPLRTAEVFIRSMKGGDYDLYVATLSGQALMESTGANQASREVDGEKTKTVRQVFKQQADLIQSVSEVRVFEKGGVILGQIQILSRKEKDILRQQIKLQFTQTPTGWRIDKVEKDETTSVGNVEEKGK